MQLPKRNKTTIKTKEQARQEKQWFLIDAKGKTLGRLATEIAKILMGKHKVTYTPHVDTGDAVIVVNAGEVKVTGAKEAQKIYRYYTGALSGLREVPYRVMKERRPTYMLEQAVKKMMPKTRLGESQFKKLRIYAGESHEMQAQQPLTLNM